MPTGTIARLLIDKGFGFIRDEGGMEHFFHRSAVRGAVFELLREGQRVEFTPEESAKGPRAATFASSRAELPSVVPGPRHTGAGTLGSVPPARFTTRHHRRKRTGPGGPPGLQNRPLSASAGRLGSTPRRFRQSDYGLQTLTDSASARSTASVSLKSSKTTSAPACASASLVS